MSSGLALLSLASSLHLWAITQFWLGHFIFIICLGIFTPAQILLESFLIEFYFDFLVQFQFYLTSLEVSNVLIFIHSAASTFLL